VGRANLPFLGLWRQFLDRQGQIKADLAARFLDCHARQHDLESIKDYSENNRSRLAQSS
jgi:hypothetical protein